MNIKCCPCTDNAIASGTDPEGIPDAVTIAPIVQVIPVNGQQVAGIVSLPVCCNCREQQLAPVSKTGLVTA